MTRTTHSHKAWTDKGGHVMSNFRREQGTTGPISYQGTESIPNCHCEE